MVLERIQIDIETTYKDEVGARLRNALDTMVEFGASQDQVVAGYERINAVAEKFGISQAQAANALNKLADESEDASFALDNLENAIIANQREGGKLEDTASRMGRRFSETRGQITLTNKALNNLGLGLAGVTVAFGKLAADGIRKAIEANGAYRDSLERATASTEKLHTSLGDAILEAVNFGTVGEELVDILEMITIASTDSRDRLNDMADVLGHVATAAAFAVTGGPLPTIAAQLLQIEVTAKGATSALRTLFQLANPKAAGAFAGQDAAAGSRAGDAAQGVLGIADQAVREGQQQRRLEDLTARERRAVAEEKAFREAERLDAEFQTFGRREGDAPGGGSGGGGGGGGSKRSRGVLDFEPTAKASAQRLKMLGGISDGDLSFLGDERRAEEAEARAKRLLDLQNKVFSSVADMSVFEEAQERAARVTARAREEVIAYNQAVLDLANGGIAAGIDAFGQLFENMAAGEAAFKGLGANLTAALGDLLTNFGKGTLLMATMVQALETGILSPAATIGIALGAIALGSSLKGFANDRATNPQAASSAAASGGLERRFRDLTRQGGERAEQTVILNIDGRQAGGIIREFVQHDINGGRISPVPGRGV